MVGKENNNLKYLLSNAAECTVLLKNSGQFPMDKAGKIAAYGAGIRYTIKGGTGSGEVNSKETFTIEQGLEKSGFTIASKNWLDAYDEVRKQAKKQFFKELKAQAKAKHENAIMYSMGKTMKEPDHNLEITKLCDTAIYVISRNSGEGSDREVLPGDVKLAKSEIRDILLLNKMYDRFMLVLNVGGVVDLSPVMEVKDILLLSQLGTDCGAVLADILRGKQNPSGKLSTTWARFEEYSSEGTFGDWNDNRYKEGIYVGYRYFDTFKKSALFPFGFGLSYTTFETQAQGVKAEKDSFTCKVLVKNTGNHAGKEVVQVYLSVPADKLDQPYQQLVGYAKTPLLESNAECMLEISFRLSDFASYDEEAESYVLEKGRYIIRVGNSSVDTKTAAVATLEETVTTLKTRNCLGKPDFTDIKSGHFEPASIPEGITNITLTADDFEKREVSFDRETEIDSRIKALSDEELAYMQIGNFDPNAKGLSIIGNAATHLAGAAGETTSQLSKKGIRPFQKRWQRPAENCSCPVRRRTTREFLKHLKTAH